MPPAIYTTKTYKTYMFHMILYTGFCQAARENPVKKVYFFYGGVLTNRKTHGIL